MERLRDGAMEPLHLSDLHAASLLHSPLASLATPSPTNKVNGWVTSEQQQQLHSSHQRSSAHHRAPSSPVLRGHLLPAPSTHAMPPLGIATGGRLRANAISPSRRTKEAIGAISTTGPGGRGSRFDEDVGVVRKALSSASSSASVQVDYEGVWPDAAPPSSPANFADGAAGNVSTLSGTSRPVTPTFVEARGGRVPRAYRGDLSPWQVYLILLLVISSFVFVSYPTDTAEELREIQMIFGNPPVTSSRKPALPGTARTPEHLIDRGLREEEGSTQRADGSGAHEAVHRQRETNQLRRQPRQQTPREDVARTHKTV